MAFKIPICCAFIYRASLKKNSEIKNNSINISEYVFKIFCSPDFKMWILLFFFIYFLVYLFGLIVDGFRFAVDLKKLLFVTFLIGINIDSQNVEL